MRIVLTGGGTLGSVSPLVAIWQELKRKSPENVIAIFIGTCHGPEKEFLTQYPEIKFKSVPAGKLRRYFSLSNLLAPFFIIAGFFKSFFVLIFFRPKIVISAGGFVAVPVILAAKILGIKILIHQLDLIPTLSNVLVKNLASKITVTFKKSLHDYFNFRPIEVGSLIRHEAKEERLTSSARLRPEIEKIVLFLGGGTGARALHELALKTAPLLGDKIKVWQITGKHKSASLERPENYTEFEFLKTDYYEKLSQANLIVSRAGLSSIMDFSYLRKPAIIIALPKSHQEKNAQFVAENNAAETLKQLGLTPGILADKIKTLLLDKAKLLELGENINKIMKHGGEEKIAKIIINFLKE